MSRPLVGTVHDPGAGRLSADCRILTQLLPTERLLVAGENTCLGTFACRPDHPLFDAESPSTAHCLVFSRTPVWIRHERGRRYVADPTVATFHNRGRLYRRWQIVDRGDRCDWIAYADDLVADAVARVAHREPGRDPLWFPADFVPVSSHLYARQRRLFDRAGTSLGDRGEVEAVEEDAILLLGDVLAAVALRSEMGKTANLNPDRISQSSRRRALDAVQHVRAVIASAPAAAMSLRALAREAQMNPFQLCRTFRRVCGETMTSYRLRLRLLASLERLRAGERLVDVALAHGFSSHSHFGVAFRAMFGMTPTQWRGRAGYGKHNTLES